MFDKTYQTIMYDLIQTGRPPTRTHRGLVTSPYYLASNTGLSILQDGNSSVDAAIAVNAPLRVNHPHVAGLGGNGFWLIRSNRCR